MRRILLLISLVALQVALVSGAVQAQDRSVTDGFKTFDAGRWGKSDHLLGRSDLDPVQRVGTPWAARDKDTVPHAERWRDTFAGDVSLRELWRQGEGVLRPDLDHGLLPLPALRGLLCRRQAYEELEDRRAQRGHASPHQHLVSELARWQAGPYQQVPAGGLNLLQAVLKVPSSTRWVTMMVDL